MPMDVAHSITRVLVPLLCFLCTLRILKKEKPHPIVLSRVYDKAG